MIEDLVRECHMPGLHDDADPTSEQHKEVVEELKAIVKSLAQEAREGRQKASETSGMDRWKLQQEQRDLRSTRRGYHLAYAFMKGTPYKKVEPRCLEENEPFIGDIEESIDCVCETLFNFVWVDPDEIEAWVSGTISKGGDE